MAINRFIILFVGIMTLVFWSCRTSPEPDNIIKNKNELDQILDQHITDGSYPFLYAHIENIDGDILYQHSTVNKDIFPALSVNKDTMIMILSMSKIVTIAIIMDLVEENIIQLNDSVSDYIPEFSNLKVAQSLSGVSLSRYTNADFVSNPEMDAKLDAPHNPS